MTGRLSLHLLPAGDGDCLFIEAIDSGGSVCTILVDGGREHTYADWCPLLRRLLGERKRVDLVVVTHMDADHIGGILAMVLDDGRAFDIDRIWFNGRGQVEAALMPEAGLESLGAKQADALSKAIIARAIPWNDFVDGGPVVGGVPAFDLGPMRLTVLTPTRPKLGSLAGIWDAVVAEVATPADERDPGFETLGVTVPDVEALVRIPDRKDTARANGSSIGFLLDVFGKSLLFAGDCHSEDLTYAISGLTNHEDGARQVDVFKLSHHGAGSNTSKDLLEKVVAGVYAISANGRHDHPSSSTIAKVLKNPSSPKTLAFNYRTRTTECWDNDMLRSEHGYSTMYPDAGYDGYLRITLV